MLRKCQLMWVGSCKRERQNCEISHIDRTNKALIVYKVEQKLLSSCLCVEHRELASGPSSLDGNLN